MSLSPILFANGDKTVVLLDLPMSIAFAQYLEPSPIPRQLLSCKPQTAPYPSNDPKHENARQRLLSTTSASDRVYHEEVQSLIRQSLHEIHSSYLGPWCLERQVFDDSPTQNSLCHGRSRPPSPHQKHEAERLPPLILSLSLTEVRNLQSLGDSMAVNFFHEETRLKIADRIFRIPPISAFLLSDVTLPPDLFSAFVKSLLQDSDDPATGVFDLVVVDPPWTNRSVRRSQNYATSEDQIDDPFDAIEFVFEEHVAIGGVVAIWITNKELIRTKVVQKLRQRGFEFLEEWIWLKVTAEGEPITPLEGLWRHPYEICLIFRYWRCSGSLCSLPRRRILVACPDLHSRKPSLKQLTELLFSELQLKWCLEIFARNLTAGWVSWGKEALKYANEQAWSDRTRS